MLNDLPRRSLLSAALMLPAATKDLAGHGMTYLAGAIAGTNLGRGGLPSAIGHDVQQPLVDGQAVWAEKFGANPSASATTNVTAIRAALASAKAAGDSSVRLGAGTYNLASATLCSMGLAIPAGVKLVGMGRELTKLIITGSTECSLLVIEDVSRVSIEGIWFYGNSVANSSGPGSAVYVHHSVAATAHMADITICDCRFENFKGDYWLNFYVENATYAMLRARVVDNVFVSRKGNARNGTATVVPSVCCSFSAGGTTGKVFDGLVKGNTAYCNYIKSFSATWSGCRRFDIEDNVVVNAGADASISDDSASYAFFSYNGFGSLNRPSDIRYLRNRVFGCRDAGIFLTDIANVEIDDFYCADQTSTADATLPKGVLAINATLSLKVNNLRAGGVCARGISMAGGASTDDWRFSDIDLGSACAQPVLYSSVANTARITFDGLRAHATNGRGIYIQATSTSGPDRLEIDNFDVKGTGVGAIHLSVVGTPTFKLWRIANGRVGDFGINAPNLPASPLVIDTVTFEDTWSATSVSLDVHGSKKVQLKNLQFVGCPTLYHLNTESSEGTLSGVTFSACTTGKFFESSSNLGVSTPTWVGSPGDYVQNIRQPTDASASGTTSSLRGWRFTNGATWVAEHTR